MRRWDERLAGGRPVTLGGSSRQLEFALSGPLRRFDLRMLLAPFAPRESCN